MKGRNEEKNQGVKDGRSQRKEGRRKEEGEVKRCEGGKEVET